MNDNKSNKDNIENLINAFAGLTEQDIEQAIALIREEGLDPDRVLAKGLKKLSIVQKNASRVVSAEKHQGGAINYPFPVFLNNQNTKEVFVSIKSGNEKLLSMSEIYDIVLGQAKPDKIVDEEISSWTFNRMTKELAFEITILAEFATVKASFRNAGLPSFSSAETLAILRTGYYTSNKKVWPVDSDSLQFGEIIINMLDDEFHMPVRSALSLFAAKDNYRLLRFTQAKFDLSQILGAEFSKGSNILFVRDLYDYQKDGLSWLMYCAINRTGGILADDMGLGKTAQVIAMIAALTERSIFENVLIVVPGTLLENWRREFLFFAPDIIPFIHHGSGRSGSPSVLKQHKVVITSYSMIINDQFLFNKINWGITILDEASLIKNPDSERRNALKSIDSEVRIAMTGTPVENSLTDLWSLADYVYPGYLGSKTDFSAKYIAKNIEQSLESGNLSQLRDDVSFIMLRRKKEDVLESLPEKIDIHQALTMNASEAIIYEQKRVDILDSASLNSGAVTLQLITELRMFTTHPLLRQPSALAVADAAELSKQSFKFCRILELLSEISVKKEKVLIFTEFLSMIDTFERVLTQYFGIKVFTVDGRVEVAERQTRIDLFSAEEGYAVMVLNPKTAGMGLNITAANHVIHYTRQWNPALEQQASARSYRNGQKKGVNIYYLYYADTIEEVIDNRLRSKTELSSEVITVTQADNIQEYLNALSKQH